MSYNRNAVRNEIIAGGNWTVAPHHLWRRRISPQAKLLWIYLFSNAPHFDPGTRSIVTRTGIGKSSVLRLIQELEQLGMIVVKRSSTTGRRNRYWLCPPSKWTAEIIEAPKKDDDEKWPDEEAAVPPAKGGDASPPDQSCPDIRSTNASAVGRNKKKKRNTTLTTHNSHTVACGSAEHSFIDELASDLEVDDLLASYESSYPSVKQKQVSVRQTSKIGGFPLG